MDSIKQKHVNAIVNTMIHKYLWWLLHVDSIYLFWGKLMEWNRLQKRLELKKWSRHNASPMLWLTIKSKPSTKVIISVIGAQHQTQRYRKWTDENRNWSRSGISHNQATANCSPFRNNPHIHRNNNLALAESFVETRARLPHFRQESVDVSSVQRWNEATPIRVMEARRATANEPITFIDRWYWSISRRLEFRGLFVIKRFSPVGTTRN